MYLLLSCIKPLVIKCTSTHTWELPFMVCVFLLSVLEPPVLLNNLTDCTVNVSSSVILSCPSEGVPPPTITWYKDERALSQGSGKKNNTINMQTVSVSWWLICYSTIIRYCNINRWWDPPYWSNHRGGPGPVYVPGHQWEGIHRELCLYMGQW